MKKLIYKIKEAVKTASFKASLFTLLIELLMFFPLVVLLITLLKQYSYITVPFWVVVYVFFITFIVIICFASVIYAKLLDNYNNEKPENGRYKHIFLSELLGPFGICLFIVGTVVFIDQLTKVYAVINLTNKGSIPFIKGIINFRLAYNKGAAWSMCSEHTDSLAILSLIASIVMVFFLKDFDLSNKKVYSISLAMILGGTIGNMIDRFFSVPGVVDFIETAFMTFPIFNIADSFLVVGTILLMFDLIILDYLRNKNKKSTTEAVEEVKKDE